MGNKKRKGVGDIHTHHLNRLALPNNLSKQQTKGYSEGFIRGPIGRFFGSLAYGENFKEFVRILDAKTLTDVGKMHIKEMDKAEVDYSIVLSLNFSEVDPKYDGYTIPYNQQLNAIAVNCAKYPFRFFPFFFFEPRNENVKENLKDAYEKFGIVGIKIYPAFGYDPRPEMNDFLEGRTKVIESITENLTYLYKFASDHNLPILTHCSAGGCYQCTIKKKDRDKVWGFTEPSNFLGIVQKYKLRICFAHMGGSIYSKFEKKVAKQWNNQIYNLIKCAHNNGLKTGSRFYTDYSNYLAHVISHTERINEHLAHTDRLLDQDAISDYLIFGSDWPLARFKLDHQSYINKYKANLLLTKREKYFSNNIAEFLFGKTKEIPSNFVKFLKKNNPSLTVPEWVIVKNKKYYLV